MYDRRHKVGVGAGAELEVKVGEADLGTVEISIKI
jgi:hypothetical protein